MKLITFFVVVGTLRLGAMGFLLFENYKWS